MQISDEKKLRMPKSELEEKDQRILMMWIVEKFKEAHPMKALLTWLIIARLVLEGRYKGAEPKRILDNRSTMQKDGASIRKYSYL